MIRLDKTDVRWPWAAFFRVCCTLCDTPLGPPAPRLPLCTACAHGLPRVRAGCRGCALPLGPAEAAFCGRCVRRPPACGETVAALYYRWPVDQLVLRAKFGGDLSALRALGLLLAEAVRARGAPLPQAIVPVPLHWRRLVGRGYNQAGELARVVAGELGLPVLPGCAQRRRATAAQTRLALEARRGNVRGAFRARLPEGVHRLALLDDVVTTGATVEALALALRRAGARELQCWCVARAA